MLQGYEGGTAKARTLRATMSLPEVMLWAALKARPNGFKFRRQHPSGPYVADFYCHAARLVVEVDGAAHERGGQPTRDDVRDRWFAARGLATMRIAAVEILRDLDAVVRGIAALAKARLGEGE